MFKNNVGKDVTICLVRKIKPNITKAARNWRKTGFVKEKATYLFAIRYTRTELIEIINDAKAKPLKPKLKINKGVKIQVRAVQNTMKYKVIFTLPIALRKFVRGVEIDEKTVFRAKKERDRIAGSHLEYLGIRSIKNSEYWIMKTAVGKMKKDIRNRDFSIASLKAFGSCCKRL